MKSRRSKILFIVFLAIVVLMAGIAYCLFLHPFWANSGTQTEDGQSDYANQFHIEQYVSDHDEDGDGVNDQTDMLQSTRDYIATKPKYKSKYYSSGYPDDGYGVCTDVVAFACKGSGYDLMQLVADDVQAAQDDYGIETPDANIDFRRVGNLNTYFSRHAQSLTTDLGNIEEWQGGDIVVFSSHIAIVSDKRNKKGIPYIIHHVSAAQKAYEEDKMQRWEKKAGIIGHYRIGEVQ